MRLNVSVHTVIVKHSSESVAHMLDMTAKAATIPLNPITTANIDFGNEFVGCLAVRCSSFMQQIFNIQGIT